MMDKLENLWQKTETSGDSHIAYSSENSAFTEYLNVTACWTYLHMPINTNTNIPDKIGPRQTPPNTLAWSND